MHGVSGYFGISKQDSLLQLCAIAMESKWLGPCGGLCRHDGHRVLDLMSIQRFATRSRDRRRTVDVQHNYIYSSFVESKRS